MRDSRDSTGSFAGAGNAAEANRPGSSGLPREDACGPQPSAAGGRAPETGETGSTRVGGFAGGGAHACAERETHETRHAPPEETEPRQSASSSDPSDVAGGEAGPVGPERGDEAEAPATPEEEIATLDPETYLELRRRADERDAYRDELLRVKAELDNYQKRMRRERPNWEDQAVRRFVAGILPVVDNFELALASAVGGGVEAESLAQGVQMIYQLLQKTLEDSGIEEIPALGETFDPDVHEAVAEEEVTDIESGTVVGVQQKGYVHKGVVVRPSRVVVARKVDKAGGEA